MANIEKIKLPNGTTYDIKDSGALPLTGGTVTGPVIFQDTTSMDEATIGDLVVNGNASFTNNIQANTINGVVVGNSPKFTDTITTASTTGSGNAVTAVTASNGVLTVTKGTTFLTSHQDISGKADKSATVSTVAYDSTNKKITKTINGTTSDVVTVATLKTALGYTASDVGALPSNTTYVSTITTTAGTHSAISSKSGAVSFNVPTKTSHLTNDSGFITSYTDEKLKISTATSGSSYYPLLGNGTSAATRQYDSAFQFSGTNGTASGGGGSTTLTLGNSTTSSTAGWRRGIIQLYGYGAYSTTIENRTSTDNRTIILPDNSGTVALTSDIPDVSGKIDTAGTGLSKSGTTLNHSNSVTAQTTQAVYPIKIDKNGHISGYGSAVTSMPASDVSSWAKASSKPTYTASEVGAAASTHAHGNITSGGDITATAPTIANGDQIIINDNSASKITNGPTFDGSTTTKALTPKGTWETFLKSYTETDPTVPSWAKASSKPSYTASEVGAVPTSRTVNGKALSSNITLSASDVSALYEGTLSMSGLTAYSSRCVVSAGGYFKIGTMVFIQLRATNSGSLGSNNTWGYIDGFPIPTANSAAISAYASQNYGNISAVINNVGRLVIATGGSALAAKTDMYFAGWYMASS